MSRWPDAAWYAQALDHHLEELAAKVRGAPDAKDDAEILRARWLAHGLELARERAIELLNSGPAMEDHP